MALENLFIRPKKSIAGIQLDAVLSEAYENSASVTRHPVEFGADASDHVIIEPKRVIITADVTDSPLGVQAFAAIVDNVTGLFGSSTSENITRSQAAYNAFVQLMEARELINVQTGLRLYQNMVITDVNTLRDRTTSRIVRLLITLDEMIIRETQVVQLPPETLEEGRVRNQASSAEETGRRSSREPGSSTRSSVIQKTRRWITGGDE